MPYKIIAKKKKNTLRDASWEIQMQCRNLDMTLLIKYFNIKREIIMAVSTDAVVTECPGLGCWLLAAGLPCLHGFSILVQSHAEHFNDCNLVPV